MKLLCYQAATLQHRKGKALKNKMQAQNNLLRKNILILSLAIRQFLPTIH